MKAWIIVAAIGVALAGVGVPAAASTRQSRTAGSLFAVTYEASGGSEHYQGDVFGDAVCIDGNENVPGLFSDTTTVSATGLSVAQHVGRPEIASRFYRAGKCERTPTLLRTLARRAPI